MDNHTELFLHGVHSLNVAEIHFDYVARKGVIVPVFQGIRHSVRRQTRPQTLQELKRVRSAQRFKLNDGMGFEHRNRYLAIYEIESDDPQEALAEMFRRRGTPAMVVSESLDLDKASVGLFEPCSSVVEAGAKPRQAAAR